MSSNTAADIWSIAHNLTSGPKRQRFFSDKTLLPQKSAFAKNEPPGEEEIDYIGEGLNVDRLSPDKKSANGKGFSHIKRNLSNEFDQAIQIVEEGKYPILTNPFRIELAGLLYLRK